MLHNVKLHSECLALMVDTKCCHVEFEAMMVDAEYLRMKVVAEC
jgi:hypothetical protein